jgi:hypothetical protein
MRIRDIEIDHDGLSDGLRLQGLSPGLNVVVTQSRGAGANLLKFLRGLFFCPRGKGSLSASAASGSLSGGRVVVEHDDCTYTVRHVDRPGHCDTFALCAVGRAADHFSAFRDAWRDAACEPLLSLFLASLGHPWTGDQPPQWAEAIASLAAARADAARAVADASAPCSTAIRAAEQRYEHLRREAAVLQTARQRRQRSFAAELQQVHRALESAHAEIARLDEMWQAAAVDLREREDRLWSPESVAPHSGPNDDETADDAIAAHIRVVLGDLAERRKQLSIAMADLASGPPTASPPASRSASVRAETERLRIDRCETELLHQLQCLPGVTFRRGRSGHAPAAHTTTPVPDSADDKQAAPTCPCASQIDALVARSADLAAQLAAARQHDCELRKRRDQLERERRRVAADRTLDLQRFALAVARQQLTSLEQEQASAELYRSALEQCAPSPPSFVALTAAASQHLTTLTAGRWLRVERRADDAEWQLADDQGNWRRMAACPPLAVEQAALALRLALVAAARRCGLARPVVWNGLLREYADDDVRAAGRLLSATAGQGVQIVLITDQEHLAVLLGESGAIVHVLPETESSSPIADEDVPVPQLEDSPTSPSCDFSSDPFGEVPPPVRVHPAPPHWLAADRGLQEVPSVGPQTARQLRHMGLFDVGDLLTLDLSSSRFLLSELRLTGEQVRLWQAEAELLCRVPGLTGRDAQLLVSCGILTADELASFGAAELALRIDRLRGGASTRWLPEVGIWPRRETVQGWIHAARRARSLDSVLSEGDHWGVRGRSRRSLVPRASCMTGLKSQEAWPLEQARPFLDRDSPLVDAPSIGQKTAKLLQRIGIVSTSDLLSCDPEATASRLRHPRLTSDMLRAWQRQVALLCSIPGLRPSDARLLVACGIHGRHDLQRIAPSTLFAVLDPVLRTAEGQQLLRGDPPPTLADAARWIAASLRAAVPRAA